MPPKRKYVKKDNGTSPGKSAKTCNIKDCTRPASRSLSRQQYEDYLKDAGLALKSNRERRITPCVEHYKMIKKKKKKDDKINKIRFDARTSGGKKMH
ncbi:MAG: hypothetical protein ACTSUE_21925 [Promethearchaeota archaeon]